MECNKDKQQPKTFETLREYCKKTLILPLKYKNIIQCFKDFSPIKKTVKNAWQIFLGASNCTQRRIILIWE